MKFTTSISDLLPYLQLCSLVSNKKSSIPITNDIFFEVDETGMITVKATDLVTTVTCNLQALEYQELIGFNFLLPGKIVADLMKLLPLSPITFEMDEESLKVTITTMLGEYQFVSADPAEYPSEVEIDQLMTTIDSHTLVYGLRTAATSASDDPIRPAMSGVNVLFRPYEVIFCGTDAHILTRIKYNQDIDLEGEQEMTIDKESIKVIDKAFASGFGDLDILSDEQYLMFATPTVQVLCLKIGDKYPAYQAVIPSHSPIRLNIDANTLIGSLKRLAMFADNDNRVVMTISKNEITMVAATLDERSAKEKLHHIVYEGPRLEVAINSKYALKILELYKDREICLDFTNSRQAIKVQPQEQADTFEIFSIIMPMTLEND